MATHSQIRKIHALKNILGLDDDLYRDMLMSFDVQSSTSLTYAEAAIFVEILAEKATKLGLWITAPKKYENLKRDPSMATELQLRMIEGNWREISYQDNAEFAKKSLRKFLQNKFRIDDITFLTKKKATKVIQAILKIKNNPKRYGQPMT